MRLQPGVSIGLGKGFQIGLQVPLDLKDSKISYLLMNGEEFDPPYGDFHHRNETLFAPGDTQLMVGWNGTIPGRPILFGFNVGAALPTGKTEEDPFKAVAQEEPHQHLQFGNGTVDPIVAVLFIAGGKELGLLARASGRFPLYANKKGYQGSTAVSVAVGPTLRLPKQARTVQLALYGEFHWLSPELWDGEPGENSGLLAAGLRLGVNWNITPRLAIQANMLARVFEHSFGAQFKRPITLTLGVSGFLNLRKSKGKHPHSRGEP